MSSFKGRKANVRHIDVAIAGAGPAGLTAGLRLTDAGLSVAIVEEDADVVGASARTAEHDGFRFDLAEHRFSTSSRQIADLWDEMLPDGLTEQPRATRVHRGPAIYRPVQVSTTLGSVPSVDRLLELINSQAHSLRQPSLTPWSAEDIAPCAEVETFRYPRRGAGEMWEAMRDRIVASGRGEVLMGCKLSQLADDSQGGWRLTATGPAGGIVLAARQAINTLPLRDFLPRLYPLPRSVLEIDRLRHAGTATVALIVRGAQPFAEASVRVESGGLRAARIRNIRSWSADMLPDTHVQCVCIDFVCGDGDDLLALNDEKLTYLAMAELQALGLGDLRNVDGSTVVRQERALPIEDAEAAACIAALRGELQSAHPTLHLAGSHGLHSACDLAGETESALLAVQSVLAGQGLSTASADRRRADNTGRTPSTGPFDPGEAAASDAHARTAQGVPADKVKRAA